MGRPSKKGQVKSLHDGSYAHVVAELVQKRKASGLSQQELADRLGWRQSVVAKIETVQRRMDVVEFLRIANAVGFDPVRLIKEIRAELADRGKL